MATSLLRGGLCAALLTGLSYASPSCDAGDESCHNDETPLLQVAAHHAKEQANSSSDWGCKGYPVITPSQAIPVIQETGQRTFGWWSLPDQDLSGIASKLEPFDVAASYTLGNIPWKTQRFLDRTTFSKVSAKDGAKMMYEATKVKGVFEEVPEQLRGVFWMKGNAVDEELAVLQYGKWFPDLGIYIAALGPMTWSWADGVPKDAPGFGIMYSRDSRSAAAHIVVFGAVQNALSFKFSNCPTYSDCYRHDEGHPKNMSFGYLQLHPYGDLRNFSTGIALAGNGGAGVFSLEAEAGGESFVRKCMWGVSSTTCATMDFGSYTLQRILDGEGNPVVTKNGWGASTNWYDEFVSYMGDVGMVVWSGFEDEAAKDSLRSEMERR